MHKTINTSIQKQHHKNSKTKQTRENIDECRNENKTKNKNKEKQDPPQILDQSPH